MKTVILALALLIGINSEAAFIKASTTPQGDSANYWTEIQANVNIQSLTVQCTLGLYLSQAAFAAKNTLFRAKPLPSLKIVSADLSSSPAAICEKYIYSNYVTASSPKDNFLVGATQQ